MRAGGTGDDTVYVHSHHDQNTAEGIIVAPCRHTELGGDIFRRLLSSSIGQQFFCLRKRIPRTQVDSLLLCFILRPWTWERRPLKVPRQRYGSTSAWTWTTQLVEYYAKQGFFHATNQHDPQVQLQTALEMLELQICKNSIATKGLHYILEPKRWRQFLTSMHGRFITDKSFRTKFLCSIDRTLQVCFELVSSLDKSEGDPDDGASLLLSKAVALMTTVEYGETLAIELLPVHLAQNTMVAAAPPSKKARSPTNAASSTRPTKKAVTTGFHHPSEDYVNANPHTSWLVKTGVDSLMLFKDRASGIKNWSKITKNRIPKRNNKPKAASLCVRFQIAGKCEHGCSLSHIQPKKTTQGEFGQTDRIMKEVFAAAAVTWIAHPRPW